MQKNAYMTRLASTFLALRKRIRLREKTMKTFLAMKNSFLNDFNPHLLYDIRKIIGIISIFIFFFSKKK